MCTGAFLPLASQVVQSPVSLGLPSPRKLEGQWVLGLWPGLHAQPPTPFQRTPAPPHTHLSGGAWGRW